MIRPAIFLLMNLLVAACGESKTDDPAPVADDRKPATEAPKPAAVEPPKIAEGTEPSTDGAAEGGGAGAEVADIILIVPLGGSKKSVSFPHKMHADPNSNSFVGGKCELCHHEVEDGAEAAKCTNSGCHDDKTDDVPVAKDSFHKTCRDGCHREVRAAQPDNTKLAKLKACKGCHAH
ncbi:MAG: cytochrome c3 family protein [Deltaproteobacteria bacterium]|nr:cytochrome c3 family protein [Deltaproteobacteria bacterium]